MKKNIMLSLLVTILVCIISMGNVNAATATPIFGGKLAGGINSVTYFQESNLLLDSRYGSEINKAFNNWKTNSNPMNGYGKAQNNLTSKIDFYLKSNSFSLLDSNTLAITQMYSAKTAGNATDGVGTPLTNLSQNWAFAKIFINDNTMGSLSSSQKQGTITHEIGHAFGLAHNNSNPNSIMCQTGAGRSTQVVQEVDNVSLRYLYS